MGRNSGEHMRTHELGPEHTGQLFRGAKHVKVDRASNAMTSILSIRLPREVFRALSIAARRRGKGPTTLARELIEQGLAEDRSESPVLALRVLTRFFENWERDRGNRG